MLRYKIKQNQPLYVQPQDCELPWLLISILMV